jgi:hypothetical protein
LIEWRPGDDCFSEKKGLRFTDEMEIGKLLAAIGIEKDFSAPKGA